MGLRPLAPEASASASSATSAVEILAGQERTLYRAASDDAPPRLRIVNPGAVDDRSCTAALDPASRCSRLECWASLLSSLGLAPFLPPMDDWQSGLMPYPVLLASQMVILARPRHRVHAVLARPRLLRASAQMACDAAVGCGLDLRCSMMIRYAIWMTIRPDQRWTGDLIPVVFHLVLASFLLCVAQYHRTGSGIGD